MRKCILVILSVLCVLALFACGLSACKKIPQTESPDGRVMPVATAMNSVYASMLASDGSKNANYFTLLFAGSYTASDGKIYDYDFGGAFDITQNNRDDDRRTTLYFEIKHGENEILLLYYCDGHLYLDYPPYAHRALISDYNLAEVVYAIYAEKEGGVVKTAADTIPSLASRVFDGCRYFSDDGADRYVFTLSYARLFDALSSFVTTWDAGFTPAELLAGLHLDEQAITALSSRTETTKLEFSLRDGVFLSAKVSTEGGSDFSLDSFSLTAGTADLKLPSSLSTFTEFDFRNFELSGTLHLSAENASSDRALQYGVTLGRDFDEVKYDFDYSFKSHYVAGQGLEFDLSLTDPNGKKSRFAIRGNYLYADLSAYGVQKFKIPTKASSDTAEGGDLWSRLGLAGFTDVEEYTFRDEMRLITLLAAARTQSGDVVTYTLGSDFFSLLSKKVGFKGLFGIGGATLSWNTANNRLQDLDASLSFGATSLSLHAASFGFGTPAESLPALADGEYVDLTSRESTRLSSRGTLAAHTAFSTEGEFLSAMLTSLSGEEVTIEAEGNVGYEADFVFGATGALGRVSARLYDSRGAELVTIYYTDEAEDNFFLIYPEHSGTRRVRTLTFAEEPFAFFNEALGASDSSVTEKILLVARSSSYTIGVQSPMISFIAERLSRIYPDLSLSALSDLKCRRYELKITDTTLTGKVVFDSDNDLTITSTKFALTFNEDVGVTEVNFSAPTAVALLADNNMPTYATVRFAGDTKQYTLSLLDYETGENAWRYQGVPDHVAAAGGATTTTVTAEATLLGRALSASLTVDISPATAVMLSGSSTYGAKYDVNTHTFGFSLYNDVSPKKALDTFRYMTVTVGSIGYVKETDWDVTGLTTKLLYEQGKRDYTVRPKVVTYFGNKITLGSVADFTVHIDGSKATAAKDITTGEDFKMEFEAYDGRDPADVSVYSDALNVLTAEGIVTVEHVEWKLEHMEELKQNNEDSLYAYATPNPDKPDKVKVRVFDLIGNYIELEIPVYFKKHVVTKASFDLTGLDGVSFDVEKQAFTFDVLKVRSISPISTDKVLPRALKANPGTSAAFEMQGLKWEFEPVESVANASGKSGKLTLVIGDNVSGHQTISLDYAFTKAEITKTALLDEKKQVIAEKTQGMYEYAFTDLNVYDAASYRYPAYIRVTYVDGEENKQEDLTAKWTFDKTFREDALWAGGDYLLTCALGSETIRVSMSFKAQYIHKYEFTEAQRTIDEALIPLTEKEGKDCLTYSVLAAIDGKSPLNYTATSGYPAKMNVTTDGEHYFETDVTWDLSAYASKADMIGIGGIVKVTATVKGQQVGVYVYVAPAVGDGDTVFVDEEKTSQTVTFRLMTPATKGYVVTDPRDKKNYPEKLYVRSGATGEEYEVAVTWTDLDNVTRLFTIGLSAGKDANEIRGETTVKAKIGAPTVGYKEISIPVAVVDSTITDITVSGLPFAASSEQTGGSTPYAITPTYREGSTDTFSYRLSLDINPYYVSPTARSSYPAYINFKLDGVAVTAAANWDLTRIPADAAVDPETETYLIYAMIDLKGSDDDLPALPNVLVPVAVNVLKRAIDKVWIDGSSQPYIDVDGYAAAPFGNDVDGTTVTLDVKVQFKGDPNKYPLKLKYDCADVVLSYDGSGLYTDLTVLVGNENGGYQEVDGYGIRVISNIVSAIKLFDEDKLEATDGVFFCAEYESLGSDKLIYTYQKVMDMGRDLPDAIWVTFGMGSTPRKVYRVGTAGAAAGGVVFDWDRNADGYIGVVLWNPSVSEAASGEKQAIYNSEQDDYNTPNAAMFFDEEAVWSEIYRDSADGEGDIYITAGTTLSRYDEQIKVDRVGKAYQVRYVTADTDGAAKIGADTRLNAGTYRLYVEVVGHNHYKGKTFKRFTITPKDITEAVELLVNGAKRQDGSESLYDGTTFAISAGVGSYPITVPLLVNGAESESVTDVVYEVDAESGDYVEAYYEFFVSVDSSVVNYTVTSTKKLRFKLLDVGFADEEESVVVIPTWNLSESTFSVGVTVDDMDVVYDPQLRNGYVISFYANKGDKEKVTVFEKDKRYYYIAYVKVPNHTVCRKEGWVSAK